MKVSFLRADLQGRLPSSTSGAPLPTENSMGDSSLEGELLYERLLTLMPFSKRWGTGGADSWAKALWSHNPLTTLNGRKGCLKWRRHRKRTSSVAWGWSLVRSLG